MKKTLSIMLFILMILPVTSLASDTADISVYFDTQTQDVIITGTGAPGDIIITVSDKDNSGPFSKTNPPYDIISVRNTGSYSATLSLPDESAGKRLSVVATDKTGAMSSDEFIYPDFNGSASIISNLDDANSLSEFETIAKSNALKLGFDTESEIYQSNESDIYAIMYATKPTELSAIDVYDLYYVSCALASFKNADSENIEKLLKDNELYLGVDYGKDFASDSRLDEKAKSEVCTQLSSANFASLLSPSETFGKYLEKTKALANIRTAENWQEIKAVIETDFSSLFDFEDLSVATLQQVYSEMMNFQYNKFEDIAVNFDTALDNVNYENNSSSSSSGGASFGGGGGGGGGSVSLPSSVEVALPEDSLTQNIGEKKPMATLPDGALSNFSDVPNGHWSYQAVSALSQAGIISGYDAYTFLPNNNITRAEFTKLVCASFGIPSLKADYTDIADDAWYSGYIGGATAYGIINGYGDTFAPNSPITRQDAAVIVYRALKNEDIILNGSADFEDFNDISLYALTAVGAFKEFGILSGDGTNFYPLNNITRAEAAKLLYNALSINN